MVNMIGDPFFYSIRDGKIPERPPKIHKMYGRFTVNLFGKHLDSSAYGREYCTSRGMWAVVTNSWVPALAKWIGNRRVLEIMGGLGWLALGLRMNGVNIVSVDDSSWIRQGSHYALEKPVTWMIEQDAVQYVRDYREEFDVIVCSWPPSLDSCLGEVIPMIKGMPFVYIGEPAGDACAPDWFDEVFIEDEKQPVTTGFFQWPGMNDYVCTGKIADAFEVRRNISGNITTFEVEGGSNEPV